MRRVLALALFAACDSQGTTSTELDPENRLLPWPSSAFLVEDATTATGWRVNIPPEAMPSSSDGTAIDPAPWNAWDGFSPMTSLVVEFASSIDPSPLCGWRDPGASLGTDSPTVIVDVDTGERVAHFAEIENSPEVAPGHTTLYLRPAARLAEGHHYAAGVRGLRNVDGSEVAVSASFGRLRAGPTPGFARDVLVPLATAGVASEELLVAWDFRTGSGRTAWGDLVAMRDDALELAGEHGLDCAVASVVEDPTDPTILRTIEGTFSVPSFLGDDGRLRRDAQGRPVAQGTHTASFTAIVPRSAAAGAAPIWIYGHGLFSARDEVTRDFSRDTAALAGALAVATDFSGLGSADLGQVLRAYLDVNQLPAILDRLRQGLIDTLVLPRTIAGACSALPAFTVGGVPIAAGDDRDYFGNSLGGTLGSTVAALSPDIARFALGVGGIDLSLMMPRATGWQTIETVFRRAYPRRIDRDLIVIMTAEQWELVEGSFAPHVLGDPLPGSAARSVLFQFGLNDTSSTNIASEKAARTLGLTELTPSATAIWGISPSPAPTTSACVPFDLGAAPLPDTTLPPPAANAVHEGVRRDPRAQAQIAAFLHDGGTVTDTCLGACVP
jgi:hypothetical protein